jgi:hypothetical protein
MDVTDRGWEVLDWMFLVKERDQWLAVMVTVMNHKNAGNFLIS